MEDIAFKLATNTTYPSWGYMVEHGATTIWELWNANTAAPVMNSQNHVMMLGDLIIWYYENLAGIKSSREYPGFKRIIMKPHFMEELDFVKASYQSVHGLIKSEWHKDRDQISWQVSIPSNTSAKVYFPIKDKAKLTIKPESQKINLSSEGESLVGQIGSGNYEFKILF
jgi:alpha-L-rhamnosidase